MNNFSHNFNLLEGQVMYRQTKFRHEVEQANLLKLAQLEAQKQLTSSKAFNDTGRSVVSADNWFRRLFARLIHQSKSFGF